MITQLKRLLGKVDAFLRNSDYWEPGETRSLDSIEYRFDHPIRDPWYTHIYWFVYRNGRRVYNFPSDTYYAIKWFVQRGRRGWSDRDTWSLDYYLDSWMPAALRHLKDHKHGVPMSMFDIMDGVDNTGNPTDEAFRKAEARWDAVMDKIIAGFEASARLQDGLYEKELGGYPMGCPVGVSRDAWEKVVHDRVGAGLLLEERDRAIFKEGMVLFTEHYGSLWD